MSIHYKARKSCAEISLAADTGPLSASSQFRLTDKQRRRLRFGELGDAMGKPRDLTAGRIAVHDTLLRRTNDDGFGIRHGRERARSIAGGDCLFDLAHGAAQARASRSVDHRAACDLARGLLCGFCVGHDL